MSKIEEAMKLIGPSCICEVNLGNILLLTGALKEAIEQHEAFKQEVSDAAEHLCKFYGVPIVMQQLERFIITKPDPLVEAMAECGVDPFENWAENLRAALAKRGLEIREKGE